MIKRSQQRIERGILSSDIDIDKYDRDGAYAAAMDLKHCPEYWVETTRSLGSMSDLRGKDEWEAAFIFGMVIPMPYRLVFSANGIKAIALMGAKSVPGKR